MVDGIVISSRRRKKIILIMNVGSFFSVVMYDDWNGIWNGNVFNELILLFDFLLELSVNLIFLCLGLFLRL